jgi:hypothetical protein
MLRCLTLVSTNGLNNQKRGKEIDKEREGEAEWDAKTLSPLMDYRYFFFSFSPLSLLSATHREGA